MSIKVINSTAVEVKWEEPKVIGMPDEDVLGYKLRFHKLLEEPKLTILIPEQRDRTITKLGVYYAVPYQRFCPCVLCPDCIVISTL
jgi:hypothetical protein